MTALPDRAQLARRTRLYAARSLRLATGRGLRQPCLFMHLPKCGGTSLAAGLYGTVPLHRRIGVIDALATRRAAAMLHFQCDDPVVCHEDLANGQMTFDLREGQMLTHMAWGTALIHGHVLWSPAAERHYCDTYSTVTMMRAPLARTLSNYRMAVRAGVIADDLDGWLASPVAVSMARVYLRYFGGATFVPDDSLQKTLAAASARIASCAVVGFLDDIDGFCARFAAHFGARPIIPHYNAAPEPMPCLTPAQAARLDDLTAPDQALYAQARARFAGPR